MPKQINWEKVFFGKDFSDTKKINYINKQSFLMMINNFVELIYSYFAMDLFTFHYYLRSSLTIGNLNILSTHLNYS